MGREGSEVHAIYRIRQILFSAGDKDGIQGGTQPER